MVINAHITIVNNDLSFHYFPLVSPVLLAFLEEDIFIVLNDTFTLNCTASGFPVPSITWLHNNTQLNLPNRTNVVIVGNNTARSVVSVLTVTMATSVDTGNYSCRAEIPAAPPVESEDIFVILQGTVIYYTIWKSL